MRRAAILLALTAAMIGAAAPAPSPTTIVTLGTAGGPRPRADRSQSANVLIVKGTPYLIDAGENVVRQLAAAGLDPVTLGTIFITHGHSDHTSGLPALLATLWEFNRRDPVTVIGPPGTQALVDGALAFLAVNGTIRSSEGYPTPITNIVRARDEAPGEIYRDANVTVTAVENSHFHFPAGSPATAYKSYSYRFATPSRIVVFTGDTGPSPAVTALAREADILVSEVSSPDDLLALYKRNGQWGRKTPVEQAEWLRHQTDEHLSPRAVGEMAAAARVKAVVLTHFTPSGDPQNDPVRYAAEVRRYFTGKVYVAKDLDRF